MTKTPLPEDPLQDLRERIDKLDLQLLDLLSERARIVLEIGAIKSRNGLPVYAPAREEILLRKLEEHNKGPLPPRSIRAIYREIISASLALEKELTILCAGSIGGLTHQAALSKFGSSVNYAFCEDVAGVFEGVEKHQVDCGVVPVETHQNGAVGQTFDCFARCEAVVSAEIRLQTGVRHDCVDRFFVIGRKTNPISGRDRTFLMFRIEDKPGALAAVLQPFVQANRNLRHFTNRPAGGGSSDLFFFAEADGHVSELQAGDFLRELSKKCRAVKVLGTFPVPNDSE
jgi:chorismate mutase-like protein